MTGSGGRPATYREVFAVAEFRALFAAQLLSVVGDQFARVALMVLVFERTGSAGLAALTYALTFLPDVLGGPLLSGLADRYPRRAVMVVTDLARAGLVAIMAVPGVPFAVLCALLVAVQLLNSPFGAARAATLPAVLAGDRFVLGSAIHNTTVQLAQVLGFAGGGAVVAWVGPSQALLLDAATFVASAALIRFGVRARPLPGRPVGHGGWQAGLRAGTVLVWRDRRLRSLVALACVAGFYITAEGLAVPYAHQIGGGAATAGLLLAAMPIGTAAGMLVLGRFVRPRTRLRLLGPMAVAACAPLTLCAFGPGLPVTFALWALAGAASSYHMVASAAFVRAVPDHGRGQAFGLAVTALRVAQGSGVLAAGLAAEHASPGLVLAVAGGVGILAAALAGRAWRAAHPGGVYE
ncbi:MAG TPA: MFS transporter [Pseudonocardiaceae bacterium]|nr:MFS transporter [Pseudonocardiaceae bacterium]